MIMAIVAFVVVVVVVGVIGAGTVFDSLTSSPTTTTVPGPLGIYTDQINRAVAAAEHVLGLNLPTREGKAAPTGLPASMAGVPRHEVLGFVPGYELPHMGPVDYADFSELVFSAVGVRGTGTLDTSSLGYEEIGYGAAAHLVSSAHAAGVPVLLSLSQSDQPTIDQLVSEPAIHAARLAAAVEPMLSANGFDGVDFDIEGQNAGESGAFSRFVSAFATDLHAKNSTWSLVVNTYPDSAMSSETFFDVRSLARSAQLFVMAYDMNDFQTPTATAPLTDAYLSDGTVLASYAAEGLASKTILGIPFYGYDFAASKASVPADALGYPFSVTYDAIIAAGHRALWDPVSETPYTPFFRHGHWHQTWFDNPMSVALKTALAAQFHFAGVGAWELGMASGHPAMSAALVDGAPVVKLPLARRS